MAFTAQGLCTRVQSHCNAPSMCVRRKAVPQSRPLHAAQSVQQRRIKTCSSRQPLASQPAEVSSNITDWVANPSIMAMALAGFTGISAGVFVPSDSGAAQAATSAVEPSQLAPLATATIEPLAPGLLLNLDQAVHTFVTSHTSESFRALIADIYISDAFICAGIAGWVLCSATCLALAPRKTAAPLALSWLFYYATCGAMGPLGADPLLVNHLKHSFARIRPSEIHHTYSFPSGHTSAAVFIVGALMTVLLPLVLQHVSAGSSSSSEASSKEGSGSSSSSLSRFDVVALSVWGAAWATTASGRILADAHWTTDTLAGGLLAVGVVSCLAWCCKSMERGISNNSAAAAEDAGP